MSTSRSALVFTAARQPGSADPRRAVEEISAAARRLLDSLVTSATPRDREVEAERARARAAERFGRS